MPPRDEILAVYEAGPDALVVWVEQVTDAHQRQVAELAAQIEPLVGAHQLQAAYTRFLNEGLLATRPASDWQTGTTQTDAGTQPARSAGDASGRHLGVPA